MVNLGFVKDFNLCPPDLPRVFFSSGGQDNDPLQLFSYPYQGRQIWELHYHVSPDKSDSVWIRELAQSLIKLNLHKWCLNVFDLLDIYYLSFEDALDRWGKIFWNYYNVDAVVYIPVRDVKLTICKVVMKWEREFTHLALRSRYDLTIELENRDDTEKNISQDKNKKLLWLLNVSNLKLRWRRKWL
jgi:hypothetical protein